MDILRNNLPAVIAALRVTAQAVVTVLIAFGVPVTPAQREAIIELGAALITISALFSVVTVTTSVPKSITATASPGAMQDHPAPAPSPAP